MVPVVAIAVCPMRYNWNVQDDGTVCYRLSDEKNFVVISIFNATDDVESKCKQYLRDYKVDDDHPPIEYIVFWSSILGDFQSAKLLDPSLLASDYVQYPVMIENLNG